MSFKGNDVTLCVYSGVKTFVYFYQAYFCSKNEILLFKAQMFNQRFCNGRLLLYYTI